MPAVLLCEKLPAFQTIVLPTSFGQVVQEL